VLGKEVLFLVDSGAEKSVAPRSLFPSASIYPTDIQLTGVSGSKLKTYGHCVQQLGVPGLRRRYTVSFIVTDTKPILGADFLSEHGLQLDMKHRQLRDPVTSIVTNLTPSSNQPAIVQVVQPISSKSFLQQHYPQLLTAPDYSSLPTTSIIHEINTTGEPLYSKPRPLSPVKYDTAKAEFDSLLRLGIVRPSSSPWASPLHMVKKPDGSWRPCGDYRRVNAVTVADRYPIPNLQYFHHRLRGATVFSKLDIVKAYHFIPVKEDDIPKTAINTPFGAFEYVRMPFGMRNSSGTFQRFIDSVLREFNFALAYVDDILVFSLSEEDHHRHLRAVLDKLADVGLKVKESKCELFNKAVTFLGYSIDEHGVKPPQDKTTSLLQISQPTDAKETVRVLGMFQFYQRCIPHFARLAAPLRKLCTDPVFNWTDHHTHAFNSLKDSLAQAAQLAYPTKDGLMSITADASNHAIGACLNQSQNGEVKPLAFFSRMLSETERRYSTFDRELLAIFSAVKKWRDVVDGMPLTVYTDHKPIVGAFSNTKPRLSDRQQRQLSFINEFVVDIVHISGKHNVVADTFSRHVTTISATASDAPVDLIGIAAEQEKDKDSYSHFTVFDIGSSKLHCETSQPNPRPVVPTSLRRLIFNRFHSLSHPGIKATIRIIASRYFWSSLKADVKLWCQQCLECQSCKVNKHTKKPIQELPTPTQRFATVHMDIVGPLDAQKDDSPRYLLTIIDSYTRWLEAIPLVNITAESVCSAFLNNWISRFGPPMTLTTDRGTQFCSEVAKRLTNILGIHHIRTTAHNPRANGLIERAHRSLKASLKCRGQNWLEQLPIVLFGLRMRPDENGVSAFSLVTGEQPLVPHVVPGNFDLTQLSTDLHQLQFPIKPTRKQTTDSHLPAKLASCEYAWLRTDRVRKPLESPYQGPYRVVKRCNDTFTLSIRDKEVANSENPCQAPFRSVDDDKMTATCDPDPKQTRTKSGRTVTFAKKPDFLY